ncbi:MAG TPA: S8 family serine peptidase [Xanthobacteraceae bacterium]|nr:S8 family serine peptidase [Xanthobacteraceae bacterium]
MSDGTGAGRVGSSTVRQRLDQAPPAIAVIDGPYDAAALAGVLAQPPVALGSVGCGVANSACDHGTFILGLMGARRDATIPGLCPDSRILHFPLFIDDRRPGASLDDLAQAIRLAVAAGARLVNLSLAILEEETQHHHGLAAALDYAAASGAVIVAAAGNQGRLAMGQLLAHPVTVPVVAVDATGSPLPDGNFGPTIARRGIAALGQGVAGYAPRGGITVMSGTSAATAVATGTLAQLWAQRPHATGGDIRGAIARLAPRDQQVPPMLDRHMFLAVLGQSQAAAIETAPVAAGARTSHAVLQGGLVMNESEGRPVRADRSAGQSANPDGVVRPAQGPGGCVCGAPGGICTCANGNSSPLHFVYVLGTVDICFPDPSIFEELRSVGVAQAKGEDMRSWCHRVLTDPKGREARYLARQLGWILKVEGHPAYHLVLRDWQDLNDLITCLGRPEGDDKHVHEDLDLVVGSSSLVPVESCPGVAVPMLVVEQLSSFSKEKIVDWWGNAKAKPKRKRKKGAPDGQDAGATDDPDRLFRMLVQSADNLGDKDEWRALNYLAVRYTPIYDKYAELAADDHDLESIKVAPSRLSGGRHIVDPVFAFRHKKTRQLSKWFVRVDVTHLFPIIVHHLTEYYDR